MATAPLLLLIVAALPRADAVPVAPAIAAPVARVVVVLASLAAALEDEDGARSHASPLALAPARASKRPARAPLVQALPIALRTRATPSLAPRVEPRASCGPPARPA